MTATVRHTYSTDNLARMTLAEVEDRYHTGMVTQDEFEAYMHVWATSPAHDGYSNGRGWTCLDGFGPEVMELVAEIREAAGICTP